ncbi:3-oxoacyl-ACP synthase III family protein [Amycolatopsis alba]|uniref:3-oxoacyl-ACP synthase III family protein n=1 Tax=Amycolatopsis alba TaxID=76020 RepID=UPI00039C0F6E|nr:ketoacyl-ACP synthase III [Amycolatopsis alba]
MPIGIVGFGSYLPGRTVTNAEVASWSGTTEDWIETATGIRERRYADDNEATSDLAIAAARAALGDDEGLRSRLAAIVLATSTPDQPQPATAALVQRALGLPGVPSFDLNAVCSGFLYALTIVEAMLTRSAPDATALVIGADKYSAIMNRADRRTVSLFGDGAGAVVLGQVPDGYGIHATHLITDGQYSEMIEVPGGGTRRPVGSPGTTEQDLLFRMNGFAVREYVLRTLPAAVHAVLGTAGMKLSEIDRLIVHQANPNLVELCAAELGVPLEKVPLTAVELGNTAVASVPVTLDSAHRRQPLRRGERILLAAVGGGLSTGAVLLTWY